MNVRNRNRIIVTLFLFAVIGFTCLMTFYAGPRMVRLRTDFERREVLYKCQRIIDGDTLEVQLRDWRPENPHPLVRVRLAGLDAPPAGPRVDPALRAWAEARGISPAEASEMGGAARKTLLAFIRKQNLLLKRADGTPLTEDLPPGSRVHAFVSGSHVNLKQLQQGLARHDPRPAHLYTDAYEAAQAEARRNRRGLWRYLPEARPGN